MTKTEFISRQRAEGRRANRGAVVWLIVFFGVPILGLALLRRFKPGEEWAWVMIIGFFTFLFGNFVAMFWANKRLHRRFGLDCPSCGARIEGTIAQVAIATDHCGACGHKVFSDDHAAS